MNRWLIASGLYLFASSLSAATVVESERTLPLVQKVDVVVVGGSCGAVAAAEAAAKAGAKVYLATSYGSCGDGRRGHAPCVGGPAMR